MKTSWRKWRKAELRVRIHSVDWIMEWQETKLIKTKSSCPQLNVLSTAVHHDKNDDEKRSPALAVWGGIQGFYKPSHGFWGQPSGSTPNNSAIFQSWCKHVYADGSWWQGDGLHKQHPPWTDNNPIVYSVMGQVLSSDENSWFWSIKVFSSFLWTFPHCDWLKMKWAVGRGKFF